MGDRRVFRTAAYERIIRALVEAAQGKGEAWFFACTASAGRTALLDEALSKLPEPPPHLVRIRDPRPAQLGLNGFVAQALGRQGADAPSEDDLVAVFELVADGHGANRALLVVDGAEQLSLQAIRYIQFACRSAPELQIIFAGAHAFRDLLADDEFAHLRRRLRPDILMPYLSDDDVSLAIQQTPAILGSTLPSVVGASAPEVAMAEAPALSAPVASNPRRRSKRITVLTAAAVVVALATLPVMHPEVLRAAISLRHEAAPSILPAYAAPVSPRDTVEGPIPAERIAPTLASNTASEISNPPREIGSPVALPSGPGRAPTEEPAGGATQSAVPLPEVPQNEDGKAAPERETAGPALDPAPQGAPPSLRSAAAESTDVTPAQAPKQPAEASFVLPAAASPVNTSPEQKPTPAPETTPIQAAAPVSAVRGAAGEAMPPALAATLLARGNAMFAVGDISAARLLFERAAAGGSIPAMEAAGRAYDPDILARLGAIGIRADEDLAASYYRRAAALSGAGHPERLQTLEARAAR